MLTAEMLPLGAEDSGGVLAGLRTRVLADRGAGLKAEDGAAKYAASSMGRIVLDNLAVHRQPDVRVAIALATSL